MTSELPPPVPPPIPPPEPAGQDLTLPHPKFPSMSHRKIYDMVTSMYLDCWNDTDVAHAMSEEFGELIDPHMVTGLRAEAAVASENQPMEVRRRWIYRYQNITVNNLVKEYMFMEQKKRFIEAKRELADEINTLVGSTPPERLCIAVNDALGRDNIGLEHIRELQNYALRFQKLLLAVTLYADARAMSQEEALQSAAEEVDRLFQKRFGGDAVRAAQMLAGLLGTDQMQYDPEDVSFFVEYKKLSGDDGNYPLMIKLLRGADAPSRHSTAMEQVLSGTGKHVTFEDIQQLIQFIRTRAVMPRESLERIRDYADRHNKDLETLRELGIRRTINKANEQAEAMAVNMLHTLAQQHLSLLDAARFVDELDIRKAAKKNITVSDLQTIMDRVNEMLHERQIRDFLDAIRDSRQFVFPTDRYIAARFTLPTE